MPAISARKARKAAKRRQRALDAQNALLERRLKAQTAQQQKVENRRKKVLLTYTTPAEDNLTYRGGRQTIGA